MASVSERADVAPAAESAVVELAVGGMTCASCAARVQARLNKLDGVTATVNPATERAWVTTADRAAPADGTATARAQRQAGLTGLAHAQRRVICARSRASLTLLSAALIRQGGS